MLVIFTAGGSAAARFGGASAQIQKILTRASFAADALEVISDPIGASIFVGARRAISATLGRALRRPPDLLRKGVDPIQDTTREINAGSIGARPDYPLEAKLLEVT